MLKRAKDTGKKKFIDKLLAKLIYFYRLHTGVENDYGGRILFWISFLISRVIFSPKKQNVYLNNFMYLKNWGEVRARPSLKSWRYYWIFLCRSFYEKPLGSSHLLIINRWGAKIDFSEAPRRGLNVRHCVLHWSSISKGHVHSLHGFL